MDASPYKWIKTFRATKVGFGSGSNNLLTLHHVYLSMMTIALPPLYFENLSISRLHLLVSTYILHCICTNAFNQTIDLSNSLDSNKAIIRLVIEGYGSVKVPKKPAPRQYLLLPGASSHQPCLTSRRKGLHSPKSNIILPDKEVLLLTELSKTRFYPNSVPSICNLVSSIKISPTQTMIQQKLSSTAHK
jgi:hypothetical protein